MLTVVPSESSSEIASALEIIKQWNPKWEPPLFMSDYSEAEQLAIAQVFPYSKFYLCDFHREQSWERWVKNHNHGLTWTTSRMCSCSGSKASGKSSY